MRGGFQPMGRNTGRHPGPALSAAKRGRTAYGQNPQDVPRKASKRRRKRPRGALSKMIAAKNLSTR